MFFPIIQHQIKNRLQFYKNPLFLKYYRTQRYVYGHRNQQKDEYSSEMIKEIDSLGSLVGFFRKNGHRFHTNIDPLALKNQSDQLISFKSLLESTITSQFDLSNIAKITKSLSLRSCSSHSNLIDSLIQIYCGSSTIEFDYVNSSEQKEWLIDSFECMNSNYEISAKDRTNIAKLLLKSQSFDRFIASKFSSVKRYSCEGAETLLILFESLLRGAAEQGVECSIIGMPHRGRNNLLTVLLNYDVQLFFRKMKGFSEFSEGTLATGDTFSHFFQSTDLNLPSIKENSKSLKMHVSMVPNPSHLEANIPVCMGKARSKMQLLNDGDYNELSEHAKNGDRVMCLQIHGDASITGQGVVAESIAIGGCPHFDIGGSIHVIVNNQVGFTTESSRGSSFQYVSDVAKTTGSPVLHVNADDPEAVVRVSRLAADFRQKFRRDIFIDLVCYRRWGHNELDDPTMTQPIMYSRINNLKSCPDAYLEKLRADFNMSADLINSEILQLVKDWELYLNQKLDSLSNDGPPKANLTFKNLWEGFDPVTCGINNGQHIINTGIPLQEMVSFCEASAKVPDGFKVHPTVQRSVINRRPQLMKKAKNEALIDWATAETLACASLLSKGHNIRICGQDIGRGTFSHRHFMLVDQVTDAIWIPLNDESNEWSGRLEVVNSPLSESAVLGFEIGMSLDDPRRLVIWEAQFGDFFNAAQVQIDTYIGSSEAKWYQQTGIVINLPHGYDGSGPEHSSCRLERWLQMTDSIETPITATLGQCQSSAKAYQHSSLLMDTDACNLHIAAPTTPAQYFHLLRRQILRSFRRPLMVVAPKTMLRLPAARNSLQDFLPETHFQHIIRDPNIKSAESVRKIIFCSGKHYYTLAEYLENMIPADKKASFALVRIEQLAPFPISDLYDVIKDFPKASSFVWSQEEHRNMGAWSFVSRRVKNFLGIDLQYAGRVELATPAVGINELHKAESLEILKTSFS